MMGYQAKWVWSNPQMTLMQSNPQMTQMTQIFGCDDSPVEIAAIGDNKSGKLPREERRENCDEPSGRRRA